MSSSKNTLTDFAFRSPRQWVHVLTGCGLVSVAFFGIGLLYEKMSRSFFSILWTIRFTVGFLPKSLILTCSSSKLTPSIARLRKLFSSSNALTFSLSFRFSCSRFLTRSLAFSWSISRFRRSWSRFLISASLRFTLTVYHGMWREVWTLTAMTIDFKANKCYNPLS